MADKSHIEWTGATWNPIVGCSILSPGCTNCYAMKMAARIEKMHPGTHYAGTTKPSKAGPVWSGKLALAPSHILTQPLRWKKPRTIFVNSMGDLFHEDVPDEWIDRVFAVMALCPQHTFQVLTKRSARMRKYLSAARAHPVGMEALEITLFEHLADPKSKVGSGCMMKGDFPHLATWPLPNVWLGISAERQQEAAERIPDLLATPAAVRFVSAEPLLGPLDFRCLTVGGDGELDALSALSWQQIWDNQWSPEVTGVPHDEAIEGFLDWYNLPVMPTGLAHPSLDWIIVGGESGNGARPMHPDWARSIRNQCAAAGVPFFFKQWGEFGPAFGVDLLPTGQPWSGDDQRAVARGVATLEQATRWMGKRRAGRFLDGVEHNAMPAPREVPFS